MSPDVSFMVLVSDNLQEFFIPRLKLRWKRYKAAQGVDPKIGERTSAELESDLET
jgi:alpha-D-ribose 1-methylphosphonate 5-triphosphate diphosphatase PhnM